jgi:hypothetical protein
VTELTNHVDVFLRKDFLGGLDSDNVGLVLVVYGLEVVVGFLASQDSIYPSYQDGASRSRRVGLGSSEGELFSLFLKVVDRHNKKEYGMTVKYISECLKFRLRYLLIGRYIVYNCRIR